MPDQTLADVKNAGVKFLEEIKKRHPKAPPPAIMGNCQGGWASAVLAAKTDLILQALLFLTVRLFHTGQALTGKTRCVTRVGFLVEYG